MSSNIVRTPRYAITAPNETFTSYLPLLPAPLKVPRRYEETKPVIVQDFTHRRIVDLGDIINRNTLAKAEEERQATIQTARAETWAEAVAVKEQAVEEAKQAAVIEQEKAIRKLQRSHDRALKEEALRVEAVMQKKMREMLETERIAADVRLESTVNQVMADCHEELVAAVLEARNEEIQKAKEIANGVKDEAAAVLAKTIVELTVVKEKELSDLSRAKELALERAVAEAHAHEIDKAEQRVAELRRQHKIDIQMKEKEISSHKKVVSQKEKELETVQKKREILYEELLKLHADYQDFIDRHPLFHKGQASYLLSSIANNPRIEKPAT